MRSAAKTASRYWSAVILFLAAVSGMAALELGRRPMKLELPDLGSLEMQVPAAFGPNAATGEPNLLEPEGSTLFHSTGPGPVVFSLTLGPAREVSEAWIDAHFEALRNDPTPYSRVERLGPFWWIVSCQNSKTCRTLEFFTYVERHRLVATFSGPMGQDTVTTNAYQIISSITWSD